MNSLFLVIVALTQIGRTMGIVDNLDKKEVVLGIMSNICPLLGEFNTPLGAEGEILSVFLWSVVCPVLERTAVALNDQAAERLGLNAQVNRSGRDYSLGQRRVDGVKAAAQPLPQPRPRPTPPYWVQLAARGAAWRRERAVRINQRRSGSLKRPNLLQLLLRPLNNFAASL